MPPSTADMTLGPAVTRDEALRGVEVGIETARDLVAAGESCLLTRDIGIANTTASAALIAVFAGSEPSRSPAGAPASTSRPGSARSRDPAGPGSQPAQPRRSARDPSSGGRPGARRADQFILGGAALQVPVIWTA